MEANCTCAFKREGCLRECTVSREMPLCQISCEECGFGPNRGRVRGGQDKTISKMGRRKVSHS
jgi:hypothetical protein